jgi:hypothetical protein
MKNYIIGTLIVVILALSSLIYKYHTTENKTLSVLYPIEFEEASESPILNLYVFFSKKNCKDCLGIIEVLNELPTSEFVVKGVVPDYELEDINEIRSITGATFSIEGDKKFRNLIPKYTPAIVGLSKKSDLFFILPGVPGEKDYLERFLNSIYQKVYPYLLTIK